MSVFNYNILNSQIDYVFPAFQHKATLVVFISMIAHRNLLDFCLKSSEYIKSSSGPTYTCI